MKRKMKSNTKKIIVFITTALVSICVLIVISLVAYVLVCNANDEVPFVGNHAVLRVATGSMETTIPTGSFIVVEKVLPEDIVVGDIVTFTSRDPAILGKLNTHRVVDIKIDESVRTFITKGDNNSAVDRYPVLDTDIKARYIRGSEFIKGIFNFFVSPWGLVIVIIVPSIFIVVVNVVDIAHKKKLRNIAKTVNENDRAKIDAEIERLKSEDKDSDIS